LEAVSKQVAAAQSTYDSLVKLQQDAKDLQSMNIQYDTTLFAQQQADLQNKLNQQVPQAVQDAITQLEAANSSGKIDNMDDFNIVRQDIATSLDQHVGNFALTNATERQQLNDWRTNTIQIQQDQIKAANTVNEALSKNTGYVMD